TNATSGKVSIQSGTLQFYAGGTNSGTINAASGTTMQLSSSCSFVQVVGSTTVANLAVLSGPIELPGGALVGSGLSLERNGNLTVQGGAVPQISPGTTARVGGPYAIIVAGGNSQLLGTSNEPITLSGTTGNPGQWRGIWFKAGSSAILDQLHLTGAGACW